VKWPTSNLPNAARCSGTTDFGSNLFLNQIVRPEKKKKTLLYYVILNSISLMQASANGNQGYILPKILVFTFYYAIITLPIPYYKTYVIHGIIAHKQTNLIYG